MGQPTVTRAVQDYLKAIYKLQRSEERVSTAGIANELGISPASVTAMIKRLRGERLLDYEKYRGVRLTDQGRRNALQVIRRHRIIEQFLTKVLGLTWDEVHEEAEKLEHAMSDTLIDRMDELLGHPATDPHGDPIPTKEGHVQVDRLRSLSDLEPGSEAVVRRVSDGDPKMLRYAQSIGLVPDRAVSVLSREPFGGPIKVRIDGVEHSLGDQLAREVFVSSKN